MGKGKEMRRSGGERKRQKSRSGGERYGRGEGIEEPREDTI